MSFNARHFYVFTAAHSFLIGLLPFFMPVLLWQKGGSLAEISFFIALSGLGFLFSLIFWDRLRSKLQWMSIIAISFAMEVLVVTCLYFDTPLIILFFPAFIYGAYNCFYWSTQRLLFHHITSNNNVGNTFGNFQVIVVVLLKLGILIGSYFIQHDQLHYILLLSLLLSMFCYAWFSKELIKPNSAIAKQTAVHEYSKPISARDKNTSLNRLKNKHHYKLVFFLDGPFLYFESFFWILTLFFIAQQSIFKLGILLVILTLILSVIFLIIKRRIDGLNQNYVFATAIIFYAFSWFLRGYISEISNDFILYSTIALIAFLTTFFRLSFNKLFFDTAKKTNPTEFIVIKSYLSQFGIFVCFLALGILLLESTLSIQNTISDLNWIYWLACPVSLLYGLFPVSSNQTNRIPAVLKFKSEPLTNDSPLSNYRETSI